MSRGIVSQRPFSRKKHRQSFRKMLNRSGVSIPEFKISKKLKSILSRGMCFFVVIVLGVIILIKLLFFQSAQVISQVKFSDDTIATYKDPYLFGFITEEVKGKNYYVLKSNKDELLSKIQKGFKIKNPNGEYVEFKFPFVGDIELQLEPPQVEEHIQKKIIMGIHFPSEINGTGMKVLETDFPLRSSKKTVDGGGTLGVQLLYYDPLVLIKINDKEFAVWNETTYVEMEEGMLLGIRGPEEEPLFLIETPQYLTGTNSLDGFFFEISLPEFIQIASLAKAEFGPHMLRFVYLAGSTRFAIFTSDQKVLYFNFPEGGDIQKQWDTQIFKYHTLVDKYPNFGNIDKIDLGSLEENKAIIKNY